MVLKFITVCYNYHWIFHVPIFYGLQCSICCICCCLCCDCLQDVVEKKLSQMILDKKFSGEYRSLCQL